jgi:diguanylate cyclase (GGDEF)-like protein/PAS domain S-box-containing protein
MRASGKSLLLVEDNPGDARLLREMFAAPDSDAIDMTGVTSMREAEAHLSAHGVDIILLDLGLPDSQGLDAVRRARAAAPRVPLVVLTGLEDESVAAQALQQGAQDYLVKGQIDARSLVRSLRYAIERNNLEEALSAEKDRAEATLNCIGDAVVCTDNSGHITFLNMVAQKLTGWSMLEARGCPLGAVFRTLDTLHSETTESTAEHAILQVRAVHMPPSCTLIRRDGMQIPIEESIAPIRSREGVAAGTVIVFRDVSSAKAMAQEIAHTAEHDVLTGLPNRMLLNDRVSRAIAAAKRHVKQVAVLVLDVDGFKHINDSLGHPVGDQLLQSIAQRILECARPVDTVSRQGGDEFVVLISELTHPRAASLMAGHMLRAVAEPHVIGAHQLHVTASIGVSVYPDDGVNAETLIKNADTAMYQAKENGRRRYQFFTASMNVRAVKRQSIEEGLRRALERQEFELHYQPKINLKKGVITGAEALIRWPRPAGGWISPAEFIPVAEDCALIVPIGRWVLRQACDQARAWLDAGLPATPMAVNVSAMEFQNEGFLQGLLEVVKESGWDPRLLELELTESVLMKHVEATIELLQVLRQSGVRVALDDLGTGYSSLSYLRRFPIDSLKIDRSFIQQIASGPADAAIVTAVISMARSLELRVVAEGVETLQELQFLQARECDEVQGYYFSQPLPAAKFASLLASGIAAPVLAALHGVELPRQQQC